MVSKTYPLVIHHSFDPDVAVYLFDSEEAAKAKLKELFEEEKRIELEENGNIEGEDVKFDTTDDWSWASITNITHDGFADDVTEWCIGRIMEEN